MDELVTIIMSVYNETNKQLDQSINSILNQTYKNLEIIIVNDNPDNSRISDFLNKLTDARIRILTNDSNRGLVYSLNRALKSANGKIIARMDADDISEIRRIEIEYNYLKMNKLDLVGSWIKIIDNKSNQIGELKFPTEMKGINHQIKLGGCVAHPTWLGRKTVFCHLAGYRMISYCEDYDFLLRALKAGFKIGNVPFFGLNYRVRSEGVSISNKNKQLVIRRFLAKNFDVIDKLSIDDINSFIQSQKYVNEIKSLENYEKLKKQIKSKDAFAMIQIFSNINFYRYLYERILTIFFRKKYKY